MCAGLDLFYLSSDWFRKWSRHLPNCLLHSVEINESLLSAQPRQRSETLVKYRVGLSASCLLPFFKIVNWC